MRAQTTWLSQAEKDLVLHEALGLLERIGMRMAGSRALPLLAERGAWVDEATSVVRFPGRLVREAMSLCPRSFVLAGSAPEYDVTLAEDKATAFCSSGCAAFVLDQDTGDRRPSTLADLRAATALLDESPAVDVMWTTVTANDVPFEDRELVAYGVVLEESRKHVTFVDSPTQAQPLLRIAEILSGDLDAFAARPRFSTLLTAASPLTVDGALLDFHAVTAARGVPVEVFTVPDGRRHLTRHARRHHHAGRRRIPRRGDGHAGPVARRAAHHGHVRIHHGHARRQHLVRGARDRTHERRLHRDSPPHGRAGHRARPCHRRRSTSACR